MTFFPYSLYLIIDPDLCGNDPITLAEIGIKNGVDIIQLRYKGEATAYFHHLAAQLRQLTRKLDTPLIINDRVDICLAVDADGVHLGQDDLPAQAARRLLGEKKIIGLSTHNLQQVKAANNSTADYIGLGPVFATTSKKNPDPSLGLDGLRDILPDVKLPCFAIGGINADNIEGLVKVGVKRVAVISAITKAANPTQVTKHLKTAL